MQEKKVTVIGKNGKPKERNGSSPIRESVVNIKPDTTMADLQKYTERVRQRWRVRAIQIHIHKDEGHYLSTLSELLRGAVKAVLDYVQSGYRSFSSSQEGDVKRYMNGLPDKDVAADTVLNASLPFLKSDECEKVKGQLSYIVQDMKEERQQSRSRGFHM